MKRTTPETHLTESKTLALYLKEISRFKPLSSKEEYRAAVQIKKGDKKALERLVKANLRFVVSVAKNYEHQGMSLSDLINEGNLGLIKAATRFDEKKNFRFISYAVWWIRQSILQSLAEQSRMMKIPLNRAGLIHKIGKAQIRLEQKYNRIPDIAEIAHDLNIHEHEVRESLQVRSRESSLDAPFSSTDRSRLMDVVENNSERTPDEYTHEVSLRAAVEQAFDVLDERERNVICLYFGFGDELAHTLEDIAQRYNLTRERVRQIKERGLKKLKDSDCVSELRNEIFPQ